MTTWLRDLAREAGLWASPAVIRRSLYGVAVVSVLVSLAPVLLLGENRPFGVAGIVAGLETGSVVACVIGPAVVLVIADVEFERGMREVRFLAGTAPARAASLQLAVAIGFAVSAVVITGVGSLITGVADQTGRAVASALSGGSVVKPVDFDASALARSLRFTLLAAGLTACSWAITVALRAAGRAGAIVAGGIATWAALILLVDGDRARPYLSMHPLAGLWRVLDPIPSAMGRVEAPAIAHAAAAAVWLSVLLLGLRRGLGRV